MANAKETSKIESILSSIKSNIETERAELQASWDEACKSIAELYQRVFPGFKTKAVLKFNHLNGDHNAFIYCLRPSNGEEVSFGVTISTVSCRILARINGEWAKKKAADGTVMNELEAFPTVESAIMAFLPTMVKMVSD